MFIHKNYTARVYASSACETQESQKEEMEGGKHENTTRFHNKTKNQKCHLFFLLDIPVAACLCYHSSLSPQNGLSFKIECVRPSTEPHQSINPRLPLPLSIHQINARSLPTTATTSQTDPSPSHEPRAAYECWRSTETTDLKANHSGMSSPPRSIWRNLVPESFLMLSLASLARWAVT